MHSPGLKASPRPMTEKQCNLRLPVRLEKRIGPCFGVGSALMKDSATDRQPLKGRRRAGAWTRASFLAALLTVGCTSWYRLDLPPKPDTSDLGRSQVWIDGEGIEVHNLVISPDSARERQRAGEGGAAWLRENIDSVRVRRLDPGKLVLGIAALPVALSVLFLIDDWAD